MVLLNVRGSKKVRLNWFNVNGPGQVINRLEVNWFESNWLRVNWSRVVNWPRINWLRVNWLRVNWFKIKLGTGQLATDQLVQDQLAHSVRISFRFKSNHAQLVRGQLVTILPSRPSHPRGQSLTPEIHPRVTPFMPGAPCPVPLRPTCRGRRSTGRP